MFKLSIFVDINYNSVYIFFYTKPIIDDFDRLKIETKREEKNKKEILKIKQLKYLKNLYTIYSDYKTKKTICLIFFQCH